MYYLVKFLIDHILFLEKEQCNICKYIIYLTSITYLYYKHIRTIDITVVFKKNQTN